MEDDGYFIISWREKGNQIRQSSEDAVDFWLGDAAGVTRLPQSETGCQGELDRRKGAIRIAKLGLKRVEKAMEGTEYNKKQRSTRLVSDGDTEGKDLVSKMNRRVSVRVTLDDLVQSWWLKMERPCEFDEEVDMETLSLKQRKGRIQGLAMYIGKSESLYKVWTRYGCGGCCEEESGDGRDESDGNGG
jgi:hypothetical protein